MTRPTHAKRHIQTLTRRYEHLRDRMRSSDKVLSYDASEASALRWAIEQLELRYPAPAQNESHPPAIE